MIPIPLPIPLDTLVFVIALHFGLSVGWQLGRGLTLAGRKLPDWRASLVELADEGISQYGVAMLFVTVSTVLMVGAPFQSVVLIFLFGVGIGMAYDDRENHPPEGMVKHMINKFRGEANSLEDEVE